MDNKRFSSTKKDFKRAITDFLSGYIKIEGSREERKEAVNLRLNYALRGLGLTVMAFFFSRADMFFAIRPLGAALFCAASRYIPFIYVGLILSCLFITGSSVSLFVVYSLAFLLRFSLSYMMKKDYRDPLFAENKIFKCLLSSLMLLVLGATRCISDGFLWFDFFGLIAGTISAPLLTLLFCGALEHKNKYTSYYDISLASLMSFCVYALNGYTVLGFSLSAIAAFTLALYISKECGMLRGGIIGLLSGIAYNPLYSPLFAVVGLVSGLFWRMGTLYASFAALSVGIIYGIYMDGFSSLQMLAPDLLAGALIFVPLAKFGLLPKPVLYAAAEGMSDNHNDKIAVSEKKNEASTLRFQSISKALSSLASVFYNLSCAEKKPELSQIRSSCQECFDKYCSCCPRHIICWDEYYSETEETLNKLSTDIYKGELITSESIPEYVAKRCNRIESIIKDINVSYSEQLKNALQHSKSEVFAIDYAAMSTLLEEAMNENAKEYEIDEELSRKLKGAARYLNFSSMNLCVYGKRKKRIIAGGVDLARVKLGVEEIRRSFERVCRVPLSSPNFTIDGEYITMTMKSSRVFQAEFAHASLKKADEDINGDSITFFENNEDYFYSLLSDGMGSGRDAALASRLTGVYLDRMLRAGNKKAQSIEMLNSFLRQKKQESFATVDLLEIDLLSGEASFVKSGAAPSYVLRGSSIFKIASNTMPIGITKELNAEEVTFKLEDSDVVVLISDGIAQSFEDGLWLTDMLSNDWHKGVSMQEMCEKILEEARERNDQRDDMTVGMVKIKKQQVLHPDSPPSSH